MGAVAIYLPIILEALSHIPMLINTGQQVVDAVEEIWDGVTAEEAPTEEQQAQVDEALRVAHEALQAAAKEE